MIADDLAILCCPRCRSGLSRSRLGDSLACEACAIAYPVEHGIADFSEGQYYEGFAGPDSLSEEHLRGLANENEARRIEDYYLPLIREKWQRQRGSAPGSVARPPRVLDSGCGNGQAVDVLCEHGLEGWGHDLSAMRKWQWRERANREHLVVGDGLRLPFANGTFDFVISSGVLEHIGVAETGAPRYTVTPRPDRDVSRRTYLSELARVLAPNGLLFLDFPNGAFPLDFWHGLIAGRARLHSRNEGFLPSVSEVRGLFRSIDEAFRVIPRSPYRRLRFQQVGAHWYGRAFRAPMKALYWLMRFPGFRHLAGSPINPYLVLEAGRGSLPRAN